MHVLDNHDTILGFLRWRVDQAGSGNGQGGRR